MNADTDPLSPDAIRDRSLKGAFAFGLRGIALRLLGLVGSAVLARFLAPDDFGIIAFGFTVVAFGAALANGGLGAALIQQRNWPTRRQLRVVGGFQLGAAVVIAAIGLAVALIVGGNAFVPALMMLGLPLDAARAVPAIQCERQLNFGPVVRAEIVENVAYNVLAVTLVASGSGVIGVAVANMVRAITGYATLVISSPFPQVMPVFRLREVRPILGFGAGFQGVGLLQLVRDTGANVVIAAVAGLSAVGFWSIAWRLLQPVTVLMEPFGRIMFPSMARLGEHGQDTVGPLERAIARVALLLGAVAVALAGTAPAAVPLIFGPGWDDGIDAVAVGAFGLLVFSPISICGGGYLLGRGEARPVVIGAAIQAFGWLALTAVLVPLVGVVGTAIGMVAAGMAGFAYFAYCLPLGVRQIAGAAILPILLALAGALPALAAIDAADAPDALSFGLGLAIAEGIYLALAALCRRGALRDIIDLLRQAIVRPGRGVPAGEGA